MKFKYDEKIYDDDSIYELMIDCGADDDFPEYFNNRQSAWEVVEAAREDRLEEIIGDEYSHYTEDFIHGNYADYYDVECIEE